MLRKLKSLFGDEAGVTALEYGVIAAGIIVALASVISNVGQGVTKTFTTIGNAL